MRKASGQTPAGDKTFRSWDEVERELLPSTEMSSDPVEAGRQIADDMLKMLAQGVNDAVKPSGKDQDHDMPAEEISGLLADISRLGAQGIPDLPATTFVAEISGNVGRDMSWSPWVVITTAVPTTQKRMKAMLGGLLGTLPDREDSPVPDVLAAVQARLAVQGIQATVVEADWVYL
jgi:hypothetical protein